MFSPLILFPVLAAGQKSGVDIEKFGESTVKVVLENSYSAMSALQNVGVGIASVFILFVIFYSVSSILDGGKFQVRMLWPVLIYLCVCNFNVIGGVAADFASNIQKQSVTAATSVKSNILDGKDFFTFFFDKMMMGRTGQYSAEVERFRQEQYAKNLNDALPSGSTATKAANGNGQTDTVDSNVNQDAKQGGLWGKIYDFASDAVDFAGSIIQSLSSWWTNLKAEFIAPFFTESSDEASKIEKIAMMLECGIQWLIALILQWFCNLLQTAFICLGAIMFGILVAFGPIVWAFAIIPGNGQTIKNWFLRLCQYALYSPIVVLISAFIAAMEGEFMQMLGTVQGHGMGYPVFIPMACIIVSIIALTAVPSIAASVIEGVSGAVSLSQGWNTISSTVNTVSNIGQAQSMRKMIP